MTTPLTDSRNSLPDFRPTDTLLSRQDWADLQVLEVIQQQLTQFMGKLPPDSQQLYLNTSKEESRHQERLNAQLTQWLTTFEADAKRALELEIQSVTQVQLDIDTTYLHTYSRIEASRTPRASDERTRVESKTLRQAAMNNFAFTIAHQTGSGQDAAKATAINRSATGQDRANLITLADFATAVRNVDLGSRLRKAIDTELGGTLDDHISAHQKSLLTLAALDAYRTDPQVDAAAYKRLASAFRNAGTQWEQYGLVLDFIKVELPFFIWRSTADRTTEVFSFCPGRPGGAARKHTSTGAALDSLVQQIHADASQGTLAWLTESLRDEDIEKIADHYKWDRSQLNWAASSLRGFMLSTYNALSNRQPDSQGVSVEKVGTVTDSLQDTLITLKKNLLKERLIRHSNTTTSKDWEQVKTAARQVFQETLEMLTLSVPGGVTGLNRIMLSATLGAQAYQLYNAAKALAQGQTVEFAQALVDIADLMVSARLQGVAGKLSARRTRTLVRQLGEPRKRPDASGKLWVPGSDEFKRPSEEQENLLHPQATPIKYLDGRYYAETLADEARGHVEVSYNAITGSYHKVPTRTGGDAPALSYDVGEKLWVLSAEDIQPLETTALLQQMLAPELPALDQVAALQTMKLANQNGQALVNVWHGHQQTPWQLRDALRSFELRHAMDSLLDGSAAVQRAVSALSEKMLLPLLAQACGSHIEVRRSPSAPLLTYFTANLGQVTHTLELTRDGEGLYRSEEGTQSRPLIEAVLAAHERLNKDSVVGHVGDRTRDQHLVYRVAELERQVLDALREHQSAIHDAIVNDKLQIDLPPTDATYTYSAAGTSGDTSAFTQTVDKIRILFPSLSRAAVTDLINARSFSPARLRELANSQLLGARLSRALAGAAQHSRIATALQSVQDPKGRGLNGDSEAIFCTLLTLHPNWPSSTALRVYAATPGTTRIDRASTTLLESYGPEKATSFVDIVKINDRYAGLDATGQPLHQAPRASHVNSLIDACLRSLNDLQREALGYGPHEHHKLARDILIAADQVSDSLPDMLPPARDKTLSKERLNGFEAQVDMGSTSSDAQGIYAVAGKRYLHIDSKAYQIVRDAQNSSASRKVWRIVKPGDAVADSADNTYVASRAGSNIAIVSYPQGLWMETTPGALGGMRRGSGNPKGRIAQLRRERETLIQEPMNQYDLESATIQQRINSRVGQTLPSFRGDPKPARKASHDDYAALVALHDAMLARIDAARTEKRIQPKDFLKESADIMQAKFNCLQQIMVLSVANFNDARAAFGDPGLVDGLAAFRRQTQIFLDHVVDQYPWADKAEALLQERTSLAGNDRDQLRAINQNRLDVADNPHDLKASEIKLRADLISLTDLDDSTSTPRIRPEPVLLSRKIRMAIFTHQQLEPLTPQQRIPVLESVLAQYESLLAEVEDLRVDFTRQQDVEHFSGIITALQGFIARSQEQLAADLAAPDTPLDSANVIDYDFMPAQPIARAIAPVRRRLIRTRDNRYYIGTVEELDHDGQTQVSIIDPRGQETIQRFEQQPDGRWDQRQERSTEVAEALTPAALVEQANTLLGELKTAKAKAKRQAITRVAPDVVEKNLTDKATALEEMAAQIRAANIAAGDHQWEKRVAELEAESLSARQLGDTYRVSMTKAQNPTAEGLSYLHDKGLVSIAATFRRKKLGDGDFLDEYVIIDIASGKALWYAHFHYGSSRSPFTPFLAAHLKTAQQRKLGKTYQQLREAQGRQAIEIHRGLMPAAVAQARFANIR
jgi:hypothetical protein